MKETRSEAMERIFNEIQGNQIDYPPETEGVEFYGQGSAWDRNRSHVIFESTRKLSKKEREVASDVASQIEAKFDEQFSEWLEKNPDAE